MLVFGMLKSVNIFLQQVSLSSKQPYIFSQAFIWCICSWLYLHNSYNNCYSNFDLTWQAFHPVMILSVFYFEWGETKLVTFINKQLLIHKLKPVLDLF